MPDVLSEILETKRREIAELPDADGPAPSTSDRDFGAALRGRSRAVIAELKQRSPSAGSLCEGYRPAEIATRYQQGGAAALSVLTDATYFGGRAEHLVQARSATALPVLRKDFIIDRRQVVEARRMGADACLLIVAALSHDQLAELTAAVREHAMTPLVEVHDERELETALEMGATVIGVNNRNLATLEIDRETVRRLCPLVPDEVVLIAESGISAPEEIGALPERINGVLIGTALMTTADPAAFIRATSRLTERVG